MSIAMVTRDKDDARERRSDVNEEAVRHSCRLQPCLAPSSNSDVIARARLQVYGGEDPGGVEINVSHVQVVGS